jgi:hypothetical protein
MHRSEWREFSFALHQVQNVVEPELPLAEILCNWNHLAYALAEKPRERKIQNRMLG